LQGPVKTAQILPIQWNVDVKISDFDFLFSKELAYVEKISPFFDFGDEVHQDFVSKSNPCVRNITVEFNALSKSSLGIEIR
jgi:hypothetical protein